ncbi:MAG TPA: hypothetical protein VKX17_21530 [Planctomycetota bacterium]|nr:hypothetical protein [Planctomycetota bacterium]
MTQLPRRKWLQVHLSTAIVLMFVAGGIIWANVRERWSVDIFEFAVYRELGWPFVAYHQSPASTDPSDPMYALMNADSDSNGIKRVGAPTGFIVPRAAPFSFSMAILDALTALTLLSAVWFFCEWRIRRWRVRKGERDGLNWK